MKNTNGSGKLFMGSLDLNTNEDTIIRFWESIGYKLINVDIIQSNNCNFAIIEFQSHQDAWNAIQNKNDIPSYNWDLGWVINHYNFNLTLSILNIPITLEESQLISLLLKAGYHNFGSLEVIRDVYNGHSKGIALIQFTNILDYNNALNRLDLDLIDLLNVTIAPFQKHILQTQLMNNAIPINNNNIIPQHSHSHSNNSKSFHQGKDKSNTTVFIGGLSALVTENELRDLFSPFGEIIYVKIPFGKGCGFVQYTTRQSAETAILNMKGCSIKNSKIRLSWGKSSKKNQNQNQSIPTNIRMHSPNPQFYPSIQQQNITTLHSQLPPTPPQHPHLSLLQNVLEAQFSFENDINNNNHHQN